MSLAVQPPASLPLVCGKCGRSDGVEINSEEIHCSSCGNYAFIGRPARWPFVKPTVRENRTHEIIESRNFEISKSADSDVHSPLQVAESIADKFSKEEQEQKETMSKCSKEGCDKKAWVKGYCARHYREAYGEPYKPPSQVAKTKKTKRAQEPEPCVKAKPEAVRERAEQGKIPPIKPMSIYKSPMPWIQIFLDPDLLDKLTEQAKRDYRTPELQAAFYVNEGILHG